MGRLLEELDPDLLPELDEVVQANQLAYMPFARSNRAQEQLLDHHPELAEQLEESRRRRIDSMRLRSRLVDDEQREASYQKFRVGSSEGPYTAADGQHSRSRVPKGQSPRESPSIAAKDLGDDLPFEMDEDAAKRRLPPAMSLQSPSLLPHSTDDDEPISPSLGQTPEITRNFLGGKGKEPMATSMSPRHTSSNPATPAVSIAGFGAPTTPWQTSPQVSKGLGLKDIMDQASVGRVSNLTQSLKQAEASSKSSQKVSQKERKKQAHRQKSQPQEDQAQSNVTAVTSQNTLLTRQAPWQNTKPQRTQSDAESMLDRSKKLDEAASAQGKTGMTMRQTVAGGSSPSTPAPKTTRSISSPIAASSTKRPPPAIQSIRHTPAPTKSSSSLDARTSMADILAQQQTEKSAVKEAVEKRSLQEIQQEQEFQEWWDKESQRVQEAEAQSSAATNRRGKGGRGRGRQKGAGRGVAVPSREHEDKTLVVQTPMREQTQGGGAGRSRGEARGRGRGRGRAH